MQLEIHVFQLGRCYPGWLPLPLPILLSRRSPLLSEGEQLVQHLHDILPGCISVLESLLALGPPPPHTPCVL